MHGPSLDQPAQLATVQSDPVGESPCTPQSRFTFPIQIAWDGGKNQTAGKMPTPAIGPQHLKNAREDTRTTFWDGPTSLRLHWGLMGPLPAQS